MAAKINTSMWMEPRVYRKLKMLSEKYKRPIGDVIDGLCRFSRAVKDYRGTMSPKVYEGLMETAMQNSGKTAYRAGEARDELPFVPDDIFGDMSVQVEREPEGELP